jgi:hypothetical protein
MPLDMNTMTWHVQQDWQWWNIVRQCSENDITNKKQTEKIQKSNATRVSVCHDHNHAVVTAGLLAWKEPVIGILKMRHRHYWFDGLLQILNWILYEFSIWSIYASGSRRAAAKELWRVRATTSVTTMLTVIEVAAQTIGACRSTCTSTSLESRIIKSALSNNMWFWRKYISLPCATTEWNGTAACSWRDCDRAHIV